MFLRVCARCERSCLGTQQHDSIAWEHAAVRAIERVKREKQYVGDKATLRLGRCQRHHLPSCVRARERLIRVV